MVRSIDVFSSSLKPHFPFLQVRLMLGTGLVRCQERERGNGQSGASLLHACVTSFARSPEDAPQLKEVAIGRLSIAAVRGFARLPDLPLPPRPSAPSSCLVCRSPEHEFWCVVY